MTYVLANHRDWLMHLSAVGKFEKFEMDLKNAQVKIRMPNLQLKNILFCANKIRKYICCVQAAEKSPAMLRFQSDASVLTPPFTVTVQKGKKYTLVCQCCHKTLVSDCPNLQCCSFRTGGHDRPALTTFTLLILVWCQYCLHGNIFHITHLFTGARYVLF